jgi:hypothetical protein
MKKVFFLSIFLLISQLSLAAKISVGDEIKYEVFIGSEHEMTASKKIIDYDSDYEEYKIETSRYLNLSHPHISIEVVSKKDLESQLMEMESCVLSNGQLLSLEVDKKIVSACKLIQNSGEFEIYSRDIPFGLVEAFGPIINGKGLSTKIISFKLGQ